MSDPADIRPLAVVTGASSGIGYELAKLCAQNGFDLVIAADRPGIAEAASAFAAMGAQVDHLQVDLSSLDGVDELCARSIIEREHQSVVRESRSRFFRAFQLRLHGFGQFINPTDREKPHPVLN